MDNLLANRPHAQIRKIKSVYKVFHNGKFLKAYKSLNHALHFCSTLDLSFPIKKRNHANLTNTRSRLID